MPRVHEKAWPAKPRLSQAETSRKDAAAHDVIPLESVIVEKVNWK
jgi:hypothetical protein